MRSRLLVLAAFLPSAWAQETQIDVGRFDASSEKIPAPWQVIRFDEKVPLTRYRVVSRDGVKGIEAIAEASMALLSRPLTIDLEATPVLCWRWRIDHPLKSADMMTKHGDDYAARVYVAFTMPTDELNLSTRAKLALARKIYGPQIPDAALNYVWDNRYPVGTRRPNAYTDRTQMLVLRSGASDTGRWIAERRDVAADLSQAFGVTNASPTSLAVAVDTDNTGESARAVFADLHFVPRDGSCVFRDAR